MLSIEQISVGYSNKIILKEISFSVAQGELVCIMGASGSGKSTLLKAIYGLLELDQGSVFWDGQQVTGPEDNLVPGFSPFKYVPQNFDLMPYTTVSENIAKYLSRFDMISRQKTIDTMIDIVDLSGYEHQKIKNLSGGQQQRVAIAKALAVEPKLLLLDEPFGQIDNFKKNKIRRNLFNSLKEQNIPCIIATHDAEDALSFADKIVILKEGKLILESNPKDVYKKPKDLYTASLLDDVNQIVINEIEYLLYPSQLEVVEHSNFQATVLNSYFKGSYWLIECSYQNKNIFINHFKGLDTNKIINFKFNKQ